MLLKADYQYPINPATQLFDRQIVSITHYEENGQSLDDAFNYTRKFTPRQQMKLLKKRRATVRLYIEGAVLQLMVATGTTYSEALEIGSAFIIKNNDLLNAYEAAGSRAFVNSLNPLTDAWLANPIDANGTTIKDYIISEMQ